MLVNLTPHAIIIGSVTVPPSGAIARVSSASLSAGEHEGITLVRTSFGEVIDLPNAQEGVLYIVSALVRAALPTRADLASPGDLLRDPEGKVVGCRNLIIN